MHIRELIIKDKVNLDKLSNECDFLTPNNILIYADSCEFLLDIQLIYDMFKNDGINPPLIVSLMRFNKIIGNEKQYILDPWARDFISTKTPHLIYILNEEMIANESSLYYSTMITRNIHVGANKYNIDYLPTIKKIGDLPLPSSPTNLIIEGGNSFLCVNALEEKKFIVGELGLIPRYKIRPNKRVEIIRGLDQNNKAGEKSEKKYPDKFPGKESYVRQRQLNKKILKNQLDPDVSVAVVPNAFMFHIDLEMLVLPNGVVLLHSFRETLNLIKIYKDEIKYLCDYDALVENIKKLEEKYQYLYDKTKAKLEKHNFIVKEVCGYITTTDDLDGVIAMAFNGLPIVKQDGTMVYTLPLNEWWFTNYFTNILKDCNVGVYKIMSQKPSYVAKMFGFFRCQTNTIPAKLPSTLTLNMQP